MVEIGPGRGALTRHLIDHSERIVAVELDSALTARLRAKFPERVEIVESDVLAVDLAQWGRAVVAGNLPYYISSPIIERVLSLGDALKRAVFLVQKEVAQRLAATPGTRDYGYLSVLAQFHASVEMLFVVPPAAFVPPPKVDSAVVRLTPREQPAADRTRFLAFASRCFVHKRKTLRNNLRGSVPDEILRAMPEAGLRAEQLSVAELVALHQRLQATAG